MAAACVNPAALAGGSGELHAYLDERRPHDHRNDESRSRGSTPEKPIDTPWVSVPGLLTAKCASNDNASGYLEVTVNGNPNDPRVDDIVGDIGVAPNVLANWGLHLVDVNLTMGNLHRHRRKPGEGVRGRCAEIAASPAIVSSIPRAPPSDRRGRPTAPGSTTRRTATTSTAAAVRGEHRQDRSG